MNAEARSSTATPAAPRPGRSSLAALLAALAGPGCLIEYAIGGAGATEGTGATDDSHTESTHGDSHDDSHGDTTQGDTTQGDTDGGTCPDGQAGCDACLEGQVWCGDRCVAPDACDDGVACPDGQLVCEGECAPSGACCPGGCDPARERCDAGECRCRDGLVRCGETCVDTRSDPAHCGECDEGCGDQGVCRDSKCTEGCGDGQTLCGGACVQLATDPLHCDACDAPCAGDELCLAGDCRPYTFAGECLTCPCPAACAGDLDVCCDSAYLGAAVCVDNGCG